MTARAHADAMLELARAAPGTTPLVVFDGYVPKDATGKRHPPPYALAYFSDSDPEDADSRPLEDTPGRFVLTAWWHLVGENAAATRALAERLRAALLGKTPTVAGRVCFPIRREEANPPEPDESTGGLVFDRVDVYRFASEPA
ncbi:hypothetical protein [Micromonospora globbae]|uniref:hypothetical protein n=1 Tax=Micromonospora globbae TaxID=1894969 RepID=UPI00341A7F83